MRSPQQSIRWMYRKFNLPKRKEAVICTTSPQAQQRRRSARLDCVNLTYSYSFRNRATTHLAVWVVLPLWMATAATGCQEPARHTLRRHHCCRARLGLHCPSTSKRSACQWTCCRLCRAACLLCQKWWLARRADFGRSGRAQWERSKQICRSAM